MSAVTMPLLSAAGLLATPFLRAEPLAWNALRIGGVAMLLRHAATEAGLGDPPGYRVDDCATQRNLSAEGRAQAARIGQALIERAR